MLGPLKNIPQTLNNCAPAAVAEVLGFWGIDRTQGQAQAFLRADGNSYGTAPWAIPEYVRTLGLSTLMGVQGSDQLVKALVSNGFPVIAHQWVSLSDHYGHFRPIEGFDDARGVFISADTYLGPNYAISSAEFDQIWASRDRRFIVIYPPAKESLLQAVLASAGWNEANAYQSDLAKLQPRLQQPQPATAESGFRRGDVSLNTAWDDVELANFGAANLALNQAAALGASPIVVGWIRQEMTSSRPPS